MILCSLQLFAQRGGNRLKTSISGMVTIEIVELLEMINIDHKERQWGRCPDRSIPLLLKAFVEGTPI
jgi:hypothetical protein